MVLTSPTGDLLRHVVQLYFQTTNNIVEYKGLLSVMRAVSALGIKCLLATLDSLLVVNQVHKEFQYYDLIMAVYLAEVHKTRAMFFHFRSQAHTSQGQLSS